MIHRRTSGTTKHYVLARHEKIMGVGLAPPAPPKFTPLIQITTISFRQFLVELELVMCKINSSSQLILTGDFNIDFFARSPERNIIMKYFSDEGMMLAISGVSTNYGSQLDCVFTKNVVCYYESYFSYHKPMLISLGTGLNPISTVDNHDILPHDSQSTSMTGQQSYLDDIADVSQIPNDNISQVVLEIVLIS